MSELSGDAIRHALEVARAKGFSEVVVESDDALFQGLLSALPGRVSTSQTIEATLEPTGPEHGLSEITASYVGFYQAADPPLQSGQIVAKGEIVAIINALGLANDVESPVAGRVEEILVHDGQSVEYGQVLAKVRQAHE